MFRMRLFLRKRPRGVPNDLLGFGTVHGTTHDYERYGTAYTQSFKGSKKSTNIASVELKSLPVTFKSKIWRHFGLKTFEKEGVVSTVKDITTYRHCFNDAPFKSGNTSNMATPPALEPRTLTKESKYPLYVNKSLYA